MKFWIQSRPRPNFYERSQFLIVAYKDITTNDVFYTHGMLTTGNLKRLKVDDAGVAAASTTNWLTGQGGTLTTAVNFGVASLGFDSALTSNNQLITVGVGVGNSLVQKTCDLDIED
jgi:hypothetical protein